MPVILSTDLIVFFILAMAAYFALGLRREGNLKDVWLSIKKRRPALISMLLLAAYLGTAALDSIRWRDRVAGVEGEKPGTSSLTAIYSAEALSLLDRIFAGMRTETEKTYSAPFAKRLYAKE